MSKRARCLNNVMSGGAVLAICSSFRFKQLDPEHLFLGFSLRGFIIAAILLGLVLLSFFIRHRNVLGESFYILFYLVSTSMLLAAVAQTRTPHLFVQHHCSKTLGSTEAFYAQACVLGHGTEGYGMIFTKKVIDSSSIVP